MRLEEINKRLIVIKKELDGEGADLNALEKEINELKEERKGILESIEKRKALIEGVVNLGDVKIIKDFKKDESEERKMENIIGIDTKEYRSAFLNNLRGVELNEVEKRAFTTAVGSAEAVIPVQTQNAIIEVVKQEAPLLAEINLMQVPGSVRLPIEDIVDEATMHTQNATITVSGDKLKYVDLQGFEITKLLQISKSVMQMSVDAFESWLVNSLGKAIASKITSLIIGGTGTGEAKGINGIAFNSDNSITVGKTNSLTGADVTNLIGLLPGGFDANGKFLMSKKTLFGDFMPLKDASKHDLVTREGNQYYIYGYPVMLDERITLHEAFLGDFKAGYYGNMPEDVNVVNSFDINTNSYKYLGVAMFDGKPVVEKAFVKLVKATV